MGGKMCSGVACFMAGQRLAPFCLPPCWSTQDMAPWNIVFSGPALDYIDYDTRNHTYDAIVPRAYEIMEVGWCSGWGCVASGAFWSGVPVMRGGVGDGGGLAMSALLTRTRSPSALQVLFNYKRTVEDFKKCGGKGSNPYGFPFVSECVGGGAFAGPCKDTARPVACGDSSCQSDYVSCLRAVSAGEAPGDAAETVRWAARERGSAAAARGLKDDSVVSPDDARAAEVGAPGGASGPVTATGVGAVPEQPRSLNTEAVRSGPGPWLPLAARLSLMSQLQVSDCKYGRGLP